MAAETLTATQPLTSDADGDGLAHLYCCDPDRAWCGADITYELDHAEDCSCCQECALCWLAAPTLTCGCE